MRTLVVRIVFTLAVLACPAAGVAQGRLMAFGQLSTGGAIPFELGPVAASASTAVALGTAGGYVFSEPSTGWESETPSAELEDADATAAPNAVAVSGSTVVLGYLSDDVDDVFVEPTGGWRDAMQPSAQLEDSRQWGIGGASILGGEIFASVSPYGGGKYEIDGFSQSAAGWSGTVSQTAELVDSQGWRLDLLGTFDGAVIADASDNDGHQRADVFVRPSAGGAERSDSRPPWTRHRLCAATPARISQRLRSTTWSSSSRPVAGKERSARSPRSTPRPQILTVSPRQPSATERCWAKAIAAAVIARTAAVPTSGYLTRRRLVGPVRSRHAQLRR